MATLNWPGFGLASISPTLDQPSQSNSSAWTGTRTVITDPWHGKWSFKVTLATQQGDGAFQAARAFFTSLKGQINTFHLPAVEAPQNANTGVTLSANAAQGATSLALTGVTTALVAGNMVTIAGQLLSLTSVGSLSGSAQTVNFMPTLRAAHLSGVAVETAKPYALVYLSDSSFTWDIGSWRRYGLSFSATEAVNETDGADPALDIWTGGVGSGGGTGSVFSFPTLTSFITRSVLAAVPSPSDKQVAYLTEAGREGDFVFSSANLSAKVTADPNQGIYVAPAADTTGASGAWVRKFKGRAQAEWFGVAVAGSAAANLAAMNAALATLKATAPVNIYSYPGSIGLETGDGQFDFSADIVLNHPLEFCGQLSGPYGGGGTVFRFTGNTAGVSTSITGYGAQVHGFNLVGAFTSTNSTTAHGLNLSAKITAYNLRIENFSGDGIHGYANGGGANVNDCRFSNIAIFNNRNGTWMEGGDGNASSFDDVSCFSNRLCGHRDKSFIGNVYRNGECAGNGSVSSFPTRATYSGNVYAVAMDQETWCSTNAPSGTTAHNLGWIYLGATGTRTPATAWTTGLTWYFSAPLCGGNAGGNSASLFDGIYIEADQNPCIMQSPATVRDLLPPQPNFVLYPTGSNFDAYEYTSLNERHIHGAFRTGGALTVGGTMTCLAGLNFGPGPDSGLYGIGGTMYLQVPTGNAFHFRNLSTFAAWTDIDASGVNIALGALKVAGTQVVGAQRTGWTAATGTPSRGAFAAAAAGTVSAAYVQAEAQASRDRIAALEARLIALEADSRTHGLIN